MDFVTQLRRTGKRVNNPAPEQTTQGELRDKSGRVVAYPISLRQRPRMQKPLPHNVIRNKGGISYKGNMWVFKGKNKNIDNLLMGSHIPTSYLMEDTRRMILAEMPGGLPPDIDDDSLSGTNVEILFKK